jgi:hypothetical protein
MATLLAPPLRGSPTEGFWNPLRVSRIKPRVQPRPRYPELHPVGDGAGRNPGRSASNTGRKPAEIASKIGLPKSEGRRYTPPRCSRQTGPRRNGRPPSGSQPPRSRAAHGTGPVTDLSRTLLCAGFCGKPALPGLSGQRHPTRRAKWFLGRPLRRALRSGVHVGPGAGPLRPAPGDTPRSDGRPACRPSSRRAIRLFSVFPGRDRRAARRYVHPGSTCVRRAASPRRSWKSR